jgi:hypothetical protein
MEHDVVPVVNVGHTPQHVVPGKDNRTTIPGLAQACVEAFQHRAIWEALLVVGHVPMWIHENHLQARVGVGLAMKQQDAGLGGNRDADLIRDGQPTAALEALLLEKDLDVSAQLRLLFGSEESIVSHVPLQDREPRQRKRSLADALFSSASEAEHPMTLDWRDRLFFTEC